MGISASQPEYKSYSLFDDSLISLSQETSNYYASENLASRYENVIQIKKKILENLFFSIDVSIHSNNIADKFDGYFSFKEVLAAVKQAKTQADLTQSIKTFLGERELALQGDEMDYCFTQSPANIFCYQLAKIVFPNEKPENILLQRTLTDNRITPWVDPLLQESELPRFDQFFRSERGNIESYEQILLQAMVNIKQNYLDPEKIWLGTDVRQKKYALSVNDLRILAQRSHFFQELINYTIGHKKSVERGDGILKRFITLRGELKKGDEYHKGSDGNADVVAYEGIITFSNWWRTLDKKIQTEICQLGEDNNNIGFILDRLYVRKSPGEYSQRYPNCIWITGGYLDGALSNQRILTGFKRLEKNIIIEKSHDDLDLIAGKILSELEQPLDKKIKISQRNLFMNLIGLLNEIPDYSEQFKLFNYPELKILEAFFLKRTDLFKDMSIDVVVASCNFLQGVGFSKADLNAHVITQRLCPHLNSAKMSPFRV